MCAEKAVQPENVMDFANLAAQLNAGNILPEGIVIITLLAVLVRASAFPL